jgi:hypothetical protein
VVAGESKRAPGEAVVGRRAKPARRSSSYPASGFAEGRSNDYKQQRALSTSKAPTDQAQQSNDLAVLVTYGGVLEGYRFVRKPGPGMYVAWKRGQWLREMNLQSSTSIAGIELRRCGWRYLRNDTHGAPAFQRLRRGEMATAEYVHLRYTALI